MGLFGKKKKKESKQAEMPKSTPNLENSSPFPEIPDNNMPNSAQTSENINPFPEAPSDWVNESSTNPFPEPPMQGKEVNDQDIKNVVQAEPEPKTEFNVQQVEKEKEYLDEVLQEDFDLNSAKMNNQNSQEVHTQKETIEANTDIHPEIKKKIDNHDEIIHVEIEDEPLDQIKDHVFKKKENKLESPDELMNEEFDLPGFDEDKEEIINEIKRERPKRKTIRGDIFVKTTLFGEVLHSNLVMQKDITLCINKFKELNLNINTQEKNADKLRSEFEDLRKNFAIIDEKLFENNPLMR